MNKNLCIIAFLHLCILLIGCSQTADQQVPKPRIIVTCDPELDDNNSLIRYILYASDFQTEGIIYTSSKFHWKGDGKGTTQFKEGSEYANIGLGPQTSWRWTPTERFIDDVVDAYAEAYPNLKVHNADYPTPEYVRSIVKWGNVEFEGDYSKDTEGSNLIKQVLLDEKPGPVFIQTWGGASSVAAALRSIEDEYKGTAQWNDIYKKVSEKAVLCMSGDQDGTYPSYIAKAWPDIQTQSLRGGTAPLSYMAFRSVKPEYKYYLSPEWMQEHVRSKGKLGELYRVWGDGKQMVKGDVYDYFGESGKTAEELEAEGYQLWLRDIQPKGSFLGEGDTFCYLQMIDNGLRGWQDQTWGGWSGRKFEMKVDPNATLAEQYAAMSRTDDAMPYFFPEVMDGLAARFAWAVTPNYEDANHYPVVTGPLSIEAAPGERITLNAKASDPDGDELTLKWWQFRVGTYEGEVTVDSPTTAKTTFTVPADAQPGQTIHLILEAQDNGTPTLKHYLRTVITIKN